jgi:hypothetical protein
MLIIFCCIDINNNNKNEAENFNQTDETKTMLMLSLNHVTLEKYSLLLNKSFKLVFSTMGTLPPSLTDDEEMDLMMSVSKCEPIKENYWSFKLLESVFDSLYSKLFTSNEQNDTIQLYNTMQMEGKNNFLRILKFKLNYNVVDKTKWALNNAEEMSDITEISYKNFDQLIHLYKSCLNNFIDKGSN